MMEVAGLSKSYHGARAVDDVSFSVEPGSVTGFVGPNGAGKSTTMRMMVGLVHADGGTATFDGVAYTDLSQPLVKVGTVIGGPAANPNMLVRNHLKGLALCNDIDPSRVTAVLEQVGLTDARKKRIRELSLGMGQRLCLAEALLGEPDYLILDEPFIGLDVEGIRWLRSMILHLTGSGVGILLSNHHMAEVELLADHLVVIGMGRVLANGSVQSIVDGGRSSRTRVRCRRPMELQGALRIDGFLSVVTDDDLIVTTAGRSTELELLLAANGVGSEQLLPIAPTLEDVFVDLTLGHIEHAAERMTNIDNHQHATSGMES